MNTRSWMQISWFMAFAMIAGVTHGNPSDNDNLRFAKLSASVKVADHQTESFVKHFVRFGQCQIQIQVSPQPNDEGLWDAKNPDKLSSDLRACLKTAVAEQVDVLIFPELALAISEAERQSFFEQAKEIAQKEDMIIIAGSFYDQDRRNRIAVIGPNWMELGDKIHPSRFEVSPLANEGMRPGSEILLLRTNYGDFAVITCVDLISDEVQFIVRRLATRGEIDVLININHNPAAWEFLIEANSIVRRHPVFSSITNVFSPPSKRCLQDDKPYDNGYCYGHTAIFASLRTKSSELPNSSLRLLNELPDPVVIRNQEGFPISRALPYSHVVADVGAFREGLLTYQLNMWLKRVPKTTNAPDQGYPPIRAIKIVELIRSKVDESQPDKNQTTVSD